jgi:hypothetical protein
VKSALEHLQSKILDWLLPLIGVPLLGWVIATRDWLIEVLKRQDTELLLWLLILLSSICILLGSLLILKRQKYTEYRGALFKRKPGGGYHEVVYCHSCKTPTSYEGNIPFLDRKFKCKCGWVSSFNLGDFNAFFPTLNS